MSTHNDLEDYQHPGEYETQAQDLCEAMGDNWELANMPGGFAPWYRRLVNVVLGVEEE